VTPLASRAAGRFVRIPSEFLASIAEGSERIPTLYYSHGSLSGEIFWARLRFLHALVRRHADPSGSCLDFGAGGGVFLPTLAACFRAVVALDLETAEARRVVEHYALSNVTLRQGDLLEARPPEAPFQAIVAADVLEHFRELGPPTQRLREWLAPGGFLFTSLPSESGIYEWLRRLYGVSKPPDHYHTGWEVEAYLERSGFRRRERWFVPLRVRVAPLYLVSAWSAAD